jgi:DNA-binding NarL/FixJ family response regulator
MGASVYRTYRVDRAGLELARKTQTRTEIRRKRVQLQVGMESFLFVEDDAIVARSISRFLRVHGTVRTVASVAEAVAAIEAEPWTAIIVDIRLVDGSGLDVVKFARDRRPILPALVLTGSNEPEHINRAAALGARFVCKPCGASELRPFVLEAKILSASRDPSAIDEVVANATVRWNFSIREAEIVAAALNGTTRHLFLRATGMSPNTYKVHVRSLLRKSNSDSLATLALNVLREIASRVPLTPPTPE